MNDELKYKIGYAVGRSQGVVFGALVAYGAISLVKLGYEWTKLGIETIRERKELKTNH
jgi:hypothetical protein